MYDGLLIKQPIILPRKSIFTAIIIDFNKMFFVVLEITSDKHEEKGQTYTNIHISEKVRVRPRYGELPLLPRDRI